MSSPRAADSDHVLIRVPPTMRPAAAGGFDVRGRGSDVAEVFADVARRFPELGDRLMDESGLRRYVNVYVAGTDIRLGAGLRTPLRAGDVVTILAVDGGPERRRPHEEHGSDPV